MYIQSYTDSPDTGSIEGNSDIRNQYWLDFFAANFLALILKKNPSFSFFLIDVTAFELQNKNFLGIIYLLARMYFNARQMGQIISYS